MVSGQPDTSRLDKAYSNYDLMQPSDSIESAFFLCIVEPDHYFFMRLAGRDLPRFGGKSADFVARIGGEEFVMLLSGAKLEQAMLIANQVRTAVEALRFHFRGTPVRVTVSCGLTQLKENDVADAAFDRADGALYRAKHSGKNLCVAA